MDGFPRNRKNHHLRKELREGGHERNDSTTINYLARSSLLGGSSRCTLVRSTKISSGENIVTVLQKMMY